MTKRQRIEAALKGAEVDRTPVAAWMHFPKLDTTAEGQVEAFLSFQNKYDWDFMKMMFRSTFMFEDWGCKFSRYQTPIGYWITDEYAVNTEQDWRKLHVLNPQQGVLGEMLDVVRMVNDRMDDDLFKLATVFCPLMVARQLAEKRIKTDIEENRRTLHEALEVITETVIRFAQACLESGADGIFFATQSATTDYMSADQYAEFGHPYNRKVLQAIGDRSKFTMLHVCGVNIMFEDFTNYPCHAINWDDRVTRPSLKEARAITDKCLIGGINKVGDLRTGTPENVKREGGEAIKAAGVNKLILAPGCGVPMDVPDQNLHALREAIGN